MRIKSPKTRTKYRVERITAYNPNKVNRKIIGYRFIEDGEVADLPVVKVKAAQKNPVYQNKAMLCITHGPTGEVHRLPLSAAVDYILKKAANGKPFFALTTKNKFRAHRKQMNRLSAADQAEVRSQYLLKY